MFIRDFRCRILTRVSVWITQATNEFDANCVQHVTRVYRNN